MKSNVNEFEERGGGGKEMSFVTWSYYLGFGVKFLSLAVC
jgi:hypothetical protein